MTTVQITTLGFIYLVAMNLLGMALFTFDKTAAQRGARRIPESTLLFVALIGGSAGSVTAQHLIRHKTRKQPFKAQLYTIVILQTIFAVAMCFPETRTFVIEFISDILSEGR